MVKAKRVGVLGGTFDPIHFGHLAIAQYALEAESLDKVIFVPAGQPYMKSRTITPAVDRLAMVDLAIEGNRKFESSIVDIKRKGPTYTIDTISDLKSELGKSVDLFLIVGADSIADLAKWHRIGELVKSCTILAFHRPAVKMKIAPELKKSVTVINAPLIDISATEIRDRAKAGEDITDMVPGLVAEYIKKRGMYKKNGKYR